MNVHEIGVQDTAAEIFAGGESSLLERENEENEFGQEMIEILQKMAVSKAESQITEGKENHQGQGEGEKDMIPYCTECQRESETEGKTVLFQVRNTNRMIGTRHFADEENKMGTSDQSGKWFAVTIGGIRIVQTPSGMHAEYQVVTGSERKLWACWHRYSTFRWLMQKGVGEAKDPIAFQNTRAAWEQVDRCKRLFRCLDVHYLLRKGAFLQDFLQNFLFESETEDLFSQFVHVKPRSRSFI